MTGKKVFNTQDLVLKVNVISYDTVKLPIADWDRYIDVLCSNREYQKEAIRTAIIYLASGRYKSIEDLVKENYQVNSSLRVRYNTEEEYLSKLQLKKKLSANIDLATATGKSFVMFGIAQIALGIGLVDKVLVLGPPSLTIEKGLMKKFLDLSSNSSLKAAIPLNAKHANPSIISADTTIKDNCICIENVNAVYSKSGSSIFESLAFGKGERCLVLCDEVHHVYNLGEGRMDNSPSIKKWKEFLLDSSYSFKYVLGFTGTAYVGNEYFNDVIYRFSLRVAIEKRFVKGVNYVVENIDNGENERFQKILQNHNLNKLLYPNLKPLTILITKDIKAAKQLKSRLVEFLLSKNEGSEQILNSDKVLLVTSDKDHKAAVLKLPYVDDASELVEWIISVAMLTEGWDVKNVLQIVPMEEKAFNSKLLISQVLGRGLRLPQGYPDAEVTVFNHDKWSSSIKQLVIEILEMETRVINSPIKNGVRAQYHFTVYALNYKKDYTEVETQETKVFNYKDYIEFVTETFEHKTETKFIKINDKEYPIEYTIEKEKYLISEVVEKIYEEFKIRKLEGITLNLSKNEYTSENLPSKDVIEGIIRRSMDRVAMKGDYLGKSNRQAVFSTFNTLLRKKPRSISLNKTPDFLRKVNTLDREHESISVLSLKIDTTIFYTNEYENEIVLEDSLSAFKEVKEDMKLPRQAFSEPINPFLFKTPIDLVFAVNDPERRFIQALVKNNNAKYITSWIKSKNQSFYSIEYTITTKAGKRSTQHLFNPDFLILIKNEGIDYFSIVEVKSDNDVSEENKAKYKYANEYFADLNSALIKEKISQCYLFNFLSPMNYNDYFECLKDGTLLTGKYRSELDKQLSNDEHEL